MNPLPEVYLSSHVWPYSSPTKIWYPDNGNTVSGGSINIRKNHQHKFSNSSVPTPVGGHKNIKKYRSYVKQTSFYAFGTGRTSSLITNSERVFTSRSIHRITADCFNLAQKLLIDYKMEGDKFFLFSFDDLADLKYYWVFRSDEDIKISLDELEIALLHEQ